MSMSTESLPTRTCLRILCIHDNNSSAEELYKKLQNLDHRLYRSHQVELVYVSSPLRTNDVSSDVWWEEGAEKDYLGLDASLFHLRQVLGTMPFSGMLAVGQGAGLTSLLQLMGIELEFGIFVHGHALLEDEERLVDDWPILHVCDPDFEPSRRLTKQLVGQVHETKKTEPLCNVELNAIGKFVVQQKKRLHRNVGKELVLQNQLHVVEQEAAQLVAQMVSDNPPKALMAIISPQGLGAWSGDKPQKPGGGAPCPSDFLLRKEARRDKGDDKRQCDNPQEQQQG